MPETQNTIAEVDRDTTPRVAPLPPQKVQLPTLNPVIQIACGLHHTVVLTQAGDVFTFGSNQFGQLGTGDILAYVGPVQVKLNSTVVQVAAGSNHTVLLSSRGVIYTFGQHTRGQLGRLPHDMQQNVNFLDEIPSNEDGQADISNLGMVKRKEGWNSTPGQVSYVEKSFKKYISYVKLFDNVSMYLQLHRPPVWQAVYYDFCLWRSNFLQS